MVLVLYTSITVGSLPIIYVVSKYVHISYIRIETTYDEYALCGHVCGHVSETNVHTWIHIDIHASPSAAAQNVRFVGGRDEEVDR